jgi:hypothetical protein
MAKRRPHFETLEARLCMDGGPTLQAAISLPTTGSWTRTTYRASPIFADLANTGKDDLIVVTAGAQLIAFGSNPDGSAKVDVVYGTPAGTVADIKSTPIVVTDPRTGRKDLFAAMGRDETPGAPTLEDGRLFGWDLQTGKLLPGFAQGVSTGHNPLGQSGVYGALTSGDLQGNGVPVIVATSFSHEVSAITLDGQTLWQWTNDDTVISGAVVADIDRDGKPEVVVGGDSSSNGFYQAGGWVNVLNANGQLKWRRQIPGEVTWSSPVVADLNNNGYLDIIIGTGLNYSLQNGTASTQAGNYIYAFDPFGNMLPGWPYRTAPANSTVGHEVVAAPAVADLTGNGQLDVIAVDVSGYLHVIQPNGQPLPGFEGGKNLVPDLQPNQVPADIASPIVADINGDGKPEIIASASVYLRAFDATGNAGSGGVPTSIATVPLNTAGQPEGFDIAPAIGNFNGSGPLTMAFVSNDPYAAHPGVPDQVRIYTLPQSSLVPPWPSIRRTASGDAVMRSPAFDQAYVIQAYNTLLGGQPAPGVAQPFINALNSDAIDLLHAAQLISISGPVANAQVNTIYQAYLGRAADPGGLAYWSGYLQNHSYRQMALALIQSGEFAQRANNDLGQEITQLYQGALGRNPSQSEINGWVGSKQPLALIANAILYSSEAIGRQFAATVGAMGGSASRVSADSGPAFSIDIHAGVIDQAAIALMLVSNASYAATSYTAGFVQGLYRDVIGRPGGGAEIGSWLTKIDQGQVSLAALPSLFLNSTEVRQLFVQSAFIGYLGRAADQATLTSLGNYSSREALLDTIVSGAEYFRKNGGTNALFVAAAFRDLTGVTIDQGTINAFVAQLNSGTTRAQVALKILQSDLYFNYTTVNLLEFYIPLASQGVLRTGQSPPSAAGQPINPDPNVINYFVGQFRSGMSDEQVIANILLTPQYASTVAYYRGQYRSPGIRN